MTRRVVCGALASVVLSGLAQPAAGQEGRIAAHRLGPDEREIQMDGLLGEEAWASAEIMTGFRQKEPDEGLAASERTEVRIVYDDAALYIGVAAFDSEPDDVVARILRRDRLFLVDPFGPLGVRAAGDDAIAILLDPFDDNRNGVIFGTNPNGAEFEALVADEGSSVNIDWRGVWEVAATRTPDGWSAEMAIPWRTLRYPEVAPEQGWGVNVYRMIRRKNEEVLWEAWQREGGGLHRVSRAGSLVGLQDLPSQGLNLEAKPYFLTGFGTEADGLGGFDGTGESSIGLDLKTELRPGLVLDMTFNTDFAQVEVDDAQVNLTRFNLFFPEKRDFFLENSGIFDFGIAGNPMEPPPYQMFFSRQIGISDDGEVPILGGARLTGRVGGQTVGLMNVVTGRVPGIERESFSIGRIKRDVGESNYLGAMLVDRRGDSTPNTVAGIDGQFVIGEAWVWDAFLTRSVTEGPGGDGTTYYAGYQYFGETWGSFFSHFGVGPEAEAAGGFITRTDFRRTDLYGGPTFRPDALGLRQIQWFAGGTYGSTISGNRTQDWNWGSFFAPTWDSGDALSIFVNRAETVIDDPFDLTDGVTVPAGRYTADHVGWFGNTSEARAVVLNTTGLISRFYGGSLVSASGMLTASPSPMLAFEVGFTRNLVDVPSGDFTADITSLRTSLSLSTKFFTNVLVQYNSLDEEFTANVRLNYIHRPGSDLFIVLTENRGDDVRAWNLQDRGLVMKVTYLARM